MKIRVTVTVDQLAMMVKSDEQRNAWINRYRAEIRGIERNALKDAKERYEKNLKAGSLHDTEWAERMVRSLERKIAQKRRMIEKLIAIEV